MRALRGLVLVVVLAAAACGSQSPTVSPAAPSVASPAPSDTPADTTEPSDSGGAIVPDSPVAGVVESVRPPSGTPTGFVLKTNDGETIEFVLGTLQTDSGLTAADLADRQSSAAPILVFFKPDAAGKLVVFEIEDAG